MTHKRLTLALAVPALLVSLSACGSTETDSSTKPDSGTTANAKPKSDKPAEPKTVSAPVVDKRTPEDMPKYQELVRGPATVTNEDYAYNDDPDIRGTVTITAKTATSEPANNQHWFSAKVVLKDGSAVECGESRGHIWSDFGAWEDVPMSCDAKVTLSQVARVVIID